LKRHAQPHKLNRRTDFRDPTVQAFFARFRRLADPHSRAIHSNMVSAHKSDATIIAIGVLKLLKCASLVAIGIALVYCRNKDLGEIASRWLGRLWLGRSYFDAMLVRLSSISKESVDKFAIGAFVYSVLLAIEGVGLVMRKHWAEYLTVIITASLLPFEIYELTQRLTISGVLVTLANLAIVVYLVVRLINERRQTKAKS
jgi:uncharacterized membrane protein (DUF2068 family)